MSFSLHPEYVISKLSLLTPDMLKKIGAELLILDLDNTVSPYDEASPNPQVLLWTEKMKRGGIKLYIVSNSKKIRPDIFAQAMDVPMIKYARKPSPKMIRRAIKESGVAPENTALVGDQIFTDVLGANLAGVKSILVEPIKFTNPFLALRYYVETPFRKKYKNKL